MMVVGAILSKITFRKRYLREVTVTADVGKEVLLGGDIAEKCWLEALWARAAG